MADDGGTPLTRGELSLLEPSDDPMSLGRIGPYQVLCIHVPRRCQRYERDRHGGWAQRKRLRG